MCTLNFLSKILIGVEMEVRLIHTLWFSDNADDVAI